MEDKRLIAKVDRYVYFNNENSFAIVRVKTQSDEQETITGYIPILSEDIYYEFHGSWMTHDKYGKQFKVESYHKTNDQTKEGLISYLSSAFFSGIGPKTAEKMVDRFGTEVINKVLKDKTILKEIGFSESKIEKFYNELLENQTNEHILVSLYSYNISGKTAIKILNFYGILTLSKLEENPYTLIDDVEGIGFLKADEIAEKLGIKTDDKRRIKAAIMYAIKTFSYQNGDIYISKADLDKYTNDILNLKADISDTLEALVNDGEIIIEDDRYYFYLTYQAEVNIATELERLSNYDESIANIAELETLLDMIQIQKNIEYTKKQKEAIITAIVNKVSIITGGPGTGKTTIIDGIISLYAVFTNLNLANKLIEETIALMAPTGRASKRMQDVLNLPSKTIHRHLGYGFDGVFTYDKDRKMPQKLVIVDESSMIDVFLANKLFEAIETEAKLIIVGDVDQLPSVGPGMVLKDIIESNCFPVVKLSEIHRQAKNSNIIKLANAVNKQNLQYDDMYSENDLFMKNIANNEIKGIVINQIDGALKKGYDIIDDIQVLIPTYKGDNGIDSFNQVLQERFNPNKDKFITYGDKKYYENDKVIQLVNDPKNLVMNGDIGYIKRISKTTDEKDYLVINFDGNEVIYEKGDLENINLAYAMSVHKSQGSEYKIVILPLVKHYIHMLKKELLYTAITRAKNYLIILGDINLLVYSANHLAERRKTTLKLRLTHK